MTDRTFLTQFLQMSSLQTVLFIGLLFILFIFIYKMEKKKIKFSTRMITSTLIGLVLGLLIQFVAGFPENPTDLVWLTEVSSWYSLVGNGFMDLLKMLVIPLVFLSIVRVIMNMKGENLGKMTLRSIGMLLSTTIIAAIIGVVVAHLFKLGVGESISFSNEEATLREMGSIVDTFRGLLPSNPVSAMAEGNIVAVVIFAGFIGLAIRRQSKKYSDIIEPFVKWIEAFYKIILSVAMTIIKWMPYAVIALLANTIMSRGINALMAVVNFIIAIYVSLFIMFIAHLLIVTVQGLNPFNYVKKIMEPLVLAFTSRSSLGTLPVTIETLSQKVGVDEGVASFVGSLGSNMGMNGCAGIYPALVAVMLANMAGIEMNISFYVMLIIVTAISSLGIAGLPGSATIALSVVVSGMGMGSLFPLVGGIIAIDPIIDMGRTLLNVSGTMVSATTVAKSFNQLDREVFNQK